MSFPLRVVIIASNLLLTAVALGVGKMMSGRMTTQMVEIMEIEQQWIVGAAVLYAITFLASWRFRGSFSVSATRMLVWAIVAYVAMSHSIDVVGAHRGDILTIFALDSGQLDPSMLLGIRVRLFGLLAIIGMALTSIAIGFETSEDREVK